MLHEKINEQLRFTHTSLTDALHNWSSCAEMELARWQITDMMIDTELEKIVCICVGRN